MTIHTDFPGGNLRVIRQTTEGFFLDSDLRDTTTDWFYWAFCIEGAAGQTLTFRFPDIRLGKFGPAVSHDGERWDWLGKDEPNGFTYTFGKEENKVWFAHHILYPTARIERLATRHGLTVGTLCQSRKGRSVPLLTFGEGAQTVVFTARHHACESTGNYVLEGLLEGLLDRPTLGFRVVAVPFVDYDGVLEGDQGKSRAPHDHNRDYISHPIYPETAAIMELCRSSSVLFGCDFHSPWHEGGINDCSFIVCNDTAHRAEYRAFGERLEQALDAEAFRYRADDNFPFGVDWNQSGEAQFGGFINRSGAKVGFTLETAYFGTPENPFTAARGLALGRSFAAALIEYLA